MQKDKWKDKITKAKNPQNNEESFGIVNLISGYDNNKKPIYAYYFIEGEKYLDFLNSLNNGDFAIDKFGFLIESGEGLAPSEETKARMKKEYGFDENFESDLEEIADEIFDELENK